MNNAAPRLFQLVLIAAVPHVSSCRSESSPTPVSTQSAPQPSEVVNTGAGVRDSEVIQTDVIDEAAFSLRWQPVSGTAPQAEPSGRLRGQLVLEPKAPFKINLEYPYKLKLEGAQARPTKVELTKADMQVSEGRVIVPVTYSAGSDADQALTGLFAFSVCTADKCLIERKKLRMTAGPPSP